MTMVGRWSERRWVERRSAGRRWAGRRGLGAVVALVLLALLSACNSGPTETAGQGFVEAEPGVTQVPPAERQAAPVVHGTSLDGEPLSTEDYPGKVIVINVWGSWCPPCRAEAPDLVAAADQTAEVAQFIGLNIRDPDPAQAQAFVRAFDITYPSIYDPSGAELLKFADHLPPGMIPSTLVIDADGRVAARVIGVISTGSLVALVNDVAEGR
ncbi:TlpA family protein disulfide reductase [Propionibacteriaceae bacterium Y2011]